MSVKKANIIFAGFVVLVGLSFVVASIPIYDGRVGTEPGSGVFPFWIGLMMAVCGLVYLVNSSRLQALEKFMTGVGVHNGRLIWTGVSLVAYVALMHYIGFALATFLFMAFQLLIIGRYKWINSIMISLIIAISFTYIFRIVLNIGLPTGFIGL